MMTTRALLIKSIDRLMTILIIAFMTISCGSTSGSEKMRAINMICDHVKSTNETKLREVRSKVVEAGGRNSDKVMMDELLDILTLFSISDYPDEQPESDELNKIIDALDSVSRLDTWYQIEKIRGQMDIINKLFEAFRQSEDTVDLALLAGSLQVLKSAFIEDLRVRIQLPTFEPLNVNFFMNKDSVATDQSLSVIATLEKPLDENYMSIANADIEILENEKSIGGVELVTIGNGGWIISFKPIQTGKYIIYFEGNVSILSTQTRVLMPFVGIHEIQVN